MYNYGAKGNRVSSNITPFSPIEDSTATEYGRVIAVIYDENSPYYKGPSSIGGIHYQPLRLGLLPRVNESQIGSLPFALYYETGLKIYPTEGEIVHIIQAPSKDIATSITSTSTYYLPSVNLFNKNFSNNVPNSDNIFRTLKPGKGDVILEGRSGSSIRLGALSTFDSKADPSGKPYIYLRAGQSQVSPSTETSTENINTDDSSVYLTSGGILDLQLATNTRKSYIDPPIDSNTYQGTQIAINSDRVIINSKTSDTLIASREAVGLLGKSVNLDAINYIGLDAKKIYLGEKGKEEGQPAVLGTENEKVLDKILETLTAIGNTLQDLSKTPAPATAIARLIALGPIVNSYTAEIKAMIPATKSRKVFIDSGRR